MNYEAERAIHDVKELLNLWKAMRAIFLKRRLLIK